MHMGNELKRDSCPPQLCSQKRLFLDTIPILISLLFVAVLSGSLFSAAGMDTVVIILIEVVLWGAVYAMMLMMFRKMYKRIAESYISVCAFGVCGICPMGARSKEFALPYSQIQKITAKGNRLVIKAPGLNAAFTLGDAPGTCALIQSKMMH